MIPALPPEWLWATATWLIAVGFVVSLVLFVAVTVYAWRELIQYWRGRS